MFRAYFVTVHNMYKFSFSLKHFLVEELLLRSKISFPAEDVKNCHISVHRHTYETNYSW